MNFLRFARLLSPPLAVFLLIAGLATASGQPATLNDMVGSHLDQYAANLKDIDGELQRPGLPDEQLQKLQQQAQPLPDELQNLLEHLTPRLAALKTQLNQLGTAPGAKAPRENPQVTAERAKSQAAYDEVDALVKRANLLAVQADQALTQIAERRRARMTKSLFQREPSLANPILWRDALAEAPRNIATARSEFSSWLADLNDKLGGWRTTIFWAALALIIGLYWPVSRFAERAIARAGDTATPSRLQKIVAAWRVLLVVAGFPIAATAAIGGILSGFGGEAPPLFRVVFISVCRMALALGMTQGLLAPSLRSWRLSQLHDESCAHLQRTALTVVAIVSLGRIAESVGDIIGVAEASQTLLRAVCAFLVALTIAAALWSGQPEEDESEEIFGPRTGATRDWYGLLRTVLWIVIVAVLTAVFVGFTGLARFLVDQIVWVGGVATLAAMLVILIEEVIGNGLKQNTRLGRSMMLSTGLHRDSFEQVTILLSGAARVIVVVVAVLIALAPWRVETADVSGYLYAAFFGFKIGGVTISLSRVALALLIFIAGYVATRTIERWLDFSYLPHTRLDQGLRNAIITSFSYIGWIVSLGLALGFLGLDFGKLAIVAGALSVGIGFGLQSIVNNFVSGLILLWERAIRVGDWISVGPNEGNVRRINIRSTEIETFDRAAVVIPNSDLVAGVVKNYVRTDRTGRIRIAIPVNAAADPQKARDVLLAVAATHKDVLQRPLPQVNLAEITAAAFNFELYCFVADVGTMASVKSDLNFEIYRRFKAEDLFAAPAPVLNVSLPEIEKAGIILRGNRGDVQADG